MNPRLIAVVLETVVNLVERADCALLPDMEDTPTARDELRQAKHLLAVLMDCIDE